MKSLFRILVFAAVLLNHPLTAQETKLAGMGTLNGGTLFAMDPDGTNPELWVDFTSGMNPNYTDLIESNGRLWGMTEFGGRYGLGIIFTLELDGTGFQKILDFDFSNGSRPYGSLFELNGKIWGTTLYGGDNDDGVLFNMDFDGTNYQKVHDFEWTTGAHPYDNNLVESGGKLWGMTPDGGPTEGGVIYSLDLDGSNYTVEYGLGSRGKMYVFGDKIWGAGFLFFMMDSDGTNFTDLSSISSVNNELIEYNGLIWGTQNFRGEHNSGTVFSIGMDGTGYNIIHEFELYANDNGAYPNAGVRVVDGKIWGTTTSGPGFGGGIIYSINPDGTEFTMEYEFPGGAVGAYSSKSHLLYSNGLLYGLTSEGGNSGFGTIYSIDPTNSEFIQISDFRNENGGNPYGSLIHHDGRLYGMTASGGTNNRGVIFSIAKDGTDFQKIHEFTGAESPEGRLLVYNDKLWGLSPGGGTWGTLFNINFDGSEYTTVYSFSNTNGRGARPRGSLIEYEGRLYGTTSFDGAASDAVGTVFRTLTNGLGMSSIHDFDNSFLGNRPESDVLPHDGKLWGMTENGGSLGWGVIYSIDPDGANYTKVYDLGDHSGRGNLITFEDQFWGLTYSTIFSLNTDGTGYTQEYLFTGDDGDNAEGSLIAIADKVYGMTFDGGTNDVGSVFNFNSAEGFTKLIDLSPEFGGNPTGNLLHVKDDQVITFDPLTNRTYGDADFELAASSTSSNPILYTSSDPGIVSIDGSTVTIHNAGSVTITAYQEETDFYYAASETQNLEIEPRPITVTADASSKTYGDADPTLTYSITIGSLVSPDVLTGDLDRIAGEDIGLYAISQGSLTGGDNYTISFVGNDFEITQRSITVTADDLSKTYGEADPAFTYEITSGELIGDDSFDGALDRESGEETGDYAIIVNTLTAGANYDLEFVEGTFTIDPIMISVVPDAQTKEYGDADPELTYTADPLEGADSFSGTLERVAGEAIGDYEIQIGSLTAGDNYELVLSEAFLTITQKAIEVTANDLSKAYGDSDPELTFSISSGDLVGGDEFSGSLSREAGEDVGDYAISENSLTAGANYDLTFIEGTFTVDPRSIAVAADSQTKVYGEDDPELTYSADALIGMDEFSGSLERVTGEDAGDYEIQVGSLSAGSNYELQFTTANLSITQRSVAVQGDDQTKVFNDADPGWTYSITSGSLVGMDEFSGSLSREAGEDAGVYAIMENTLTLGENYNLDYSPGTLTIDPMEIDVAADAQTKVYGEADPAFTYSGAPLVGSDEFSGALERVSGENVGSYEIQIGSLTAGDNYALIFNTENLTITQRSLTVAAEGSSKVYGSTDPDLSFSVTTGSLVESDQFSGSLSREAGEDAGTYPIEIGSLAISENYSLDFESAAFEITKAPLIVTADDKSFTQGEDVPELTASYEGFVGNEDEQVLDELPVLSTAATSESEAGEYEIAIVEIVDNNYNITTVSGVINVLTVLGVGEIVVNIYPNPASNRLVVDAKEDFERLLLYDIKGLEVAEFDLTLQNIIDVSNVQKGLYVMYLESDGILKSAGKLVLK